MAIQNNINTSSKITKFTSSGTFTINGATKAITIIGCSSGGGGGSGRRGGTGSAGGGQGGNYGSFIFYDRTPVFVFSSPISVTIGGTAAGGSARTTDNTDGNAGTASNISSFGLLIPTSSTAAKGGVSGTTTNGTAFTPLTIRIASGDNIVNSGTVTTGVNGNQVGYCFTGTAGGGGSGANGSTPQQAGNGGIRNLSVYGTAQTAVGSNFTNGAAGGISSGTINGSNGSDYAAVSDGCFVGGTGGGGGGGQSTVGGAVAGTGGNGGICGAGGGGGGGSINATNSGAGGSGSRGELWVIEYF